MKNAIIWGTMLVAALAVAPVWAAEETEAGEEVGHTHEHKAPSKDESLVDYFWRKSDEAFHAGDYERAVGLHKAVVGLAPSEIESYSVGSWLLWSMGKGDEAIAFVQRGLAANPENPEMWDAAGQHYDLQKRFGQANEAYLKAVTLAGNAAPQLLRRRLAHAAEHSGDMGLSLKTWEGLVRDYPNDVVNKNNLQRVQAKIQGGNQNAPATNTAALLGLGTAAALLGLVPVWTRRQS